MGLWLAAAHTALRMPRFRRTETLKGFVPASRQVGAGRFADSVKWFTSNLRFGRFALKHLQVQRKTRFRQFDIDLVFKGKEQNPFEAK